MLVEFSARGESRAVAWEDIRSRRFSMLDMPSDIEPSGEGEDSKWSVEDSNLSTDELGDWIIMFCVSAVVAVAFLGEPNGSGPEYLEDVDMREFLDPERKGEEGVIDRC